MRGLLIATLVLLSACEGKKEAASAPAPAPASAVTSNPADAAAAAAVVAVDAAAPSVLGDLPPLELGDADKAIIEASVALNTAGYVAHKKKNWPTAAAKYTEAIRTDPGNLLARYNLACVYVQSGEVDKALALLAQFDRPDCRACAATLLHAKQDAEWKAMAADPRFTELVGDVAVPPARMKDIAEQVIDALVSGKPDGLEPYIHPRTPVKVSTLVYGPDQDPPVPHYGWKGFVELVGKGNKALEDNGVGACEKRCCRTGERGDSSFVVDEICFIDRGGVLFVSSIEFDPGPI